MGCIFCTRSGAPLLIPMEPRTSSRWRGASESPDGRKTINAPYALESPRLQRALEGGHFDDHTMP